MTTAHATALARPAVRACSSPDIEALLGPAAWQRLPVTVRKRFAVHTAVDTRVYCGESCVRMNAVGFVLAQIGRLAGTPVAPFRGEQVPVRVYVYPDAGSGGVCWERRYCYPGQPATVVRSIKALNHRNRLVEMLGAGLRMSLRVFEQDGALHFVSQGYYFEVLGMTLHFPRLGPPGTTHVTHRDLGGGLFRFTMDVQHSLFGNVFHQDGVFADADGAP